MTLLIPQNREMKKEHAPLSIPLLIIAAALLAALGAALAPVLWPGGGPAGAALLAALLCASILPLLNLRLAPVPAAGEGEGDPWALRARGALCDAAPMGMTLFEVLDDDLRYLAVNAAVARRFRHGDEGLFGRLASEVGLPGPDDLAPWLARIGEVVRGGHVTRMEIAAAGRVQQVTLCPAGLAPSGRPLVALFDEDISARKSVERALRESEAALRALFEGAPLCMGVLEIEEPDELVHAAANPSALRCFGAGAPQLIGARASQLGVPAEHRRLWLEHLRESQRTRAPRHFAYFHDGPPGKAWVAVTVCPVLAPAGAPARDRFCYLLQDMTAQRQAEEDLRRITQVAQAASRAKSEFLANMSHEIRTPLNGVLGMTELVLSMDLKDEQREYLAMARSSGQALLGVLNDILDYSKIEAGRLDLQHVEFALQDQIADAVAAHAPACFGKGVELLLAVEPGVPTRAMGDAGRLRQVLGNLLGNAVKFTERGEVEVHVEVGRRTGEEFELLVTVRDTGVGIDPEQQALIFEAFAQGDSSATRRHGGTGLGLTISKRLLDLMGGRLWLDSEPGRGSTLRFSTPLGWAPGGVSALEIEMQAQVPALQGKAVLVVMENARGRSILLEMLGRWEVLAVGAGRGAEALDIVTQAPEAGVPVAAVLLDLAGDGQEGLALARRLVGLKTKVVALLRPETQAGVMSACLAEGLGGYVVKPARALDVRDALLRVLDEACRVPQRHGPALAPTARSLRVLLAEDNLVNQRLTRWLLEKGGHRVTVVKTGLAALQEVVERGASYDLVLMDVQMPEMDGTEAAVRIREHERTAGGHVPIIALTAHETQGDRERCREVGMDGYVSKPLREEELLRTIDQVLTQVSGSMLGEAMLGEAMLGTVPQATAAAPPPRPGRAPARAAGPEVLDRGRLLSTLGDDPELLRELATIFLGDCPNLLLSVREALRAGDARALMQAAHRLKGAVSNFSAPAATAAAQEVERIGHSGDLSEAAMACRTLEHEIERLRPALTAILQ
jgi:signal transduction histidine kinase/DNA-binding response OmpR family regulator